MDNIHYLDKFESYVKDQLKLLVNLSEVIKEIDGIDTIYEKHQIDVKFYVELANELEYRIKMNYVINEIINKISKI